MIRSPCGITGPEGMARKKRVHTWVSKCTGGREKTMSGSPNSTEAYPECTTLPQKPRCRTSVVCILRLVADGACKHTCRPVDIKKRPQHAQSQETTWIGAHSCNSGLAQHEGIVALPPCPTGQNEVRVSVCTWIPLPPHYTQVTYLQTRPQSAADTRTDPLRYSTPRAHLTKRSADGQPCAMM